ncbi:MAG: hypothetical protein COC12_01645 [Rhodobacteraceae bacterium]|nr:MAG: hypothetical protein COC12_01645 [Paracoccaceae bacterium]
MTSEIFSDKPRGKSSQKLWEKLKTLHPDVQCERRFDWLFIPSQDERSGLEATIADALIAHCRDTKDTQTEKKRACDCDSLFAGTLHPATRKLEFDFYIPSLNVAVEYDEIQHFTRERAVSLHHYDNSLNLEFSVDDWVGRCGNRNDADPPCRDWQRAFRDAVRDIRASQNGVRIFRFAWNTEPESKELSELLSVGTL